MARVRQLARDLRAGTISAVELLEQSLRTAADHADLNAFITLDPTGARVAAATADAELQAGRDRGLLHGIPIAIKDNLVTAGLRTTCASRMLADFVPPRDATVVARLREAGAVIVGKTNLDEFAMGSSSEHSAFGPVLNPMDTTRVAGGSSGGSAAAVAAGIVPVALGSDTGGSVRQPAAFCGAVGLRPTWGSVSRSGLIAFASSLDQVGPIAADVDSARLVLDAIAGPDPADATATETLSSPAGEPRLAVVDELRDVLPQDLRDRLDAVASALGCARASLPSAELAAPAYYVLASAEASTNLARFDGVRYGARQPGEDLASMRRVTRSAGFGPEVQRRILLGTFALSEGYRAAYYDRADRARRRLRSEFLAAFEGADVLLSLTAPEVAFPLGSRPDPVTMYRSDVLTIPAALAGVPAVSVPLPGEGLPVGLQIMAAPGADHLALDVAERVEALT